MGKHGSLILCTGLAADKKKKSILFKVRSTKGFCEAFKCFVLVANINETNKCLATNAI